MGGTERRSGRIPGGLVQVLRRARRMRRDALAHLAGVDLVGTLALTAYQDWAKNNAGAPTFRPLDRFDQEAMAKALVRAMVAAAGADGQIDDAERANIRNEVDEFDLPTEHKTFVMDELLAPADAPAVAQAAQNIEQAAALYVASLLTIDPDTAAEHDYLRRLAVELRLDPGLVTQLHAVIEGAVKGAR